MVEPSADRTKFKEELEKIYNTWDRKKALKEILYLMGRFELSPNRIKKAHKQFYELQQKVKEKRKTFEYPSKEDCDHKVKRRFAIEQTDGKKAIIGFECVNPKCKERSYQPATWSEKDKAYILERPSDSR